MEELLARLSPYNILNNLLPGVLFCVLVGQVTSLDLVQEDIVVGVFLYYFVGLIISRVGSAMVEPFLKFVRFVNFVDHTRYVPASKKDPLIAELSETNNMYRSLVALVTALFAALAYEAWVPNFPWVESNATWLGLLALLLLMMFAYRKQTKYIVSRVEKTEANE